MHQMVLSTLPGDRREGLVERQRAGENLRVFSVGIGGLDLGMGKAIRRATGRSRRVRWDAGEEGGGGSAVSNTSRRTGGRREPVAARAAWRRDPNLLPRVELPDHGRTACAPGENRGCGFRGGWLSRSGLHTVMGADGPDPRSRRVVVSEGAVRLIERVDEGRWIRFRLSREGPRLRVIPVEGERPSEVTGEPSGLLPGLVVLEVGTSVPSEVAAESSQVSLRLRSEGSPLTAGVPRVLLQRLVMGKKVDPAPGSPLPGLAPLPETLGEIKGVMVMLRPGQLLPPWDGGAIPVPGEENPVRLARALGRWWKGETAMSHIGVTVGTAPTASPGRWQEAPRPGKKSFLILPEGAFPPPIAGLRKSLASSWSAGPVVSSLPSSRPSGLVVLVSGEPPALLGARLREIARSPSMKGKLLAVYSLSGPIREDLPASLLAEGNLAGLGLAEAPPVGLPGVVENVSALNDALAAGRRRKTRIEKVSDLFLWFF